MDTDGMAPSGNETAKHEAKDCVLAVDVLPVDNLDGCEWRERTTKGRETDGGEQIETSTGEEVWGGGGGERGIEAWGWRRLY